MYCDLPSCGCHDAPRCLGPGDELVEESKTCKYDATLFWRTRYKQTSSCSLPMGVPWFLFIVTGSSLIFIHCHWEFPDFFHCHWEFLRLGVCRVKKNHTIYQGKPGKACTKVVEIIFIWLSLCFRGSSATESCPDFLIAVFPLLLKIEENKWTSNELRWENQYVFDTQYYSHR